jgi:hypothetical protein
MHIGANTVFTLTYGWLAEFAHPYGFLVTLIAYEGGAIVGALTYNYVYPYFGLIGASAGLYSLIGLLVAHVIVNAEYFSSRFYPSLVLLLFFQYIGDICYFFAFYNSSVGYVAHCGGMFFGFCFGLSLAVHKKPVWKKVLSVLAMLLLSLYLGFIIHNYAAVWPPRLISYNPTLHSKYDPGVCCSELFEKATDDTETALNKVRRAYVCIGTHLVYSRRS